MVLVDVCCLFFYCKGCDYGVLDVLYVFEGFFCMDFEVKVKLVFVED